MSKNNQTTESRSNTMNSTSGTEEKKEKLHIELKTLEPFGSEGGIKTSLMTSRDLCAKISSIFGEVIGDYVGAKIKLNDGSNPAVMKYLSKEVYAVNNIGVPYVELYFKDIPEDQVRGVKAITLRNSSSNGGDDMIRRMVSINSARSALAYKLTEDAMEILEEFVRPSNPNTKIIWEELYGEIQEPLNAYSDKRELLGCVTAISLKALIEKIYGTKITNDEGKVIKRYEYSIKTASRIDHPNNFGLDASYVFSISQLDHSVITKLNRELGLVREANMYHPYR